MTKILFPVSLIYNFLLGFFIFQNFFPGLITSKIRNSAEKFPVVLFQKNKNQISAVNLSDRDVKIGDILVTPSKIKNGIVYPQSVPKIPVNQAFAFAGKQFEFPSEYAKVSPEIHTVTEIASCEICEITPKIWAIPAGNHIVRTMIVVPRNVTFLIKAGANLHFTENAGIFSRSPARVEGLSQAPVSFSGINWAGVTFLAPEGVNHITHLKVIGGSGFDFAGMRFTGSLNIITGSAEIDHLLLSSTSGEDGLNLKWVQGNISNLTIRNSASDAADLDWSNINLTSTLIKSAGNDCLDLSGGKIVLKKAILESCRDKALSNGEGNILEADDFSITDSHLAIANKDGAMAKIGAIKTKNVDVFFSQYTGKAFYPQPTAHFSLKPSAPKEKIQIFSGKVSGL